MLELSDIAALRRRNERIKEASLIGVADACSPSIRDMLVCAGDELTRVGLFDAVNLRNLFIRVVESFAQHVGGAFRRREPFEQHEDRELQHLATLGAQCWIALVSTGSGSHFRTVRCASGRFWTMSKTVLAERVRLPGCHFQLTHFSSR